MDDKLTPRKRHPSRDPIPETLPEIEQEITYWTSRLGQGLSGSNWEYAVDVRLKKLQRRKEELLPQRDTVRNLPKSQGDRGVVFLACGQFTTEEKALGNRVKDFVERNTGLEVYFAENQSSLRGLTDHILGALNRCVGFIGIMHHRGVVKTPTESFVRASVWIEQEIAIASFIEHVLERKIEVQLYIQRGITREGMRDKLLLNAVEFDKDGEVLEHVQSSLKRWKSLETPLSRPGEMFDAVYAKTRDTAKSNLFVLRNGVRSDTHLWLFLSPMRQLHIALDEGVKRKLRALVWQYFPGHKKLMGSEGVEVDWLDTGEYTDLSLAATTHHQERHWRLYSSGETAFVTQVRWDIQGGRALWSLYDLAADLAYMMDATASLWDQFGYTGRGRLTAELRVTGSELHVTRQGFPALFYEHSTGLSASLALDSAAVTIAKQPRTYAASESEFDSSSWLDERNRHVGQALNLVLRGLGHSADLEKLCGTIEASLPSNDPFARLKSGPYVEDPD